MPDGQVLFSSAGAYPQAATNASLNLLAYLLDHATATDIGVWIPFIPFSRASIDVVSTGGPTYSIQLYGSNVENQPLNSFDGHTLGSAIAADGITVVNYPVRWIKAKLTLSGGTNPTVTATLNAVAP